MAWLCCFWVMVPAYANAPPQNVLVLYSDNRVLPAIQIFDETVSAVLRQQGLAGTEFFNEFLGLGDSHPHDYAQHLVTFLRAKYAGTPIAAIVAVRGPALRFLVEHREQLFPGVPIVHFGVDASEFDRLVLPADVVGAIFQPEPAKTIELAMRLQPDARRLIVITGASPLDRQWQAIARRAFEPLRQRIDIDYWSGLPMAELLQRLRTLPLDSIVFMPVMRQDGTGKLFVPQQSAAELAAAAPVPIFGAASNFRPDGTAGGYVASVRDGARVGAELLVRLLRGEAAASLGPVPPVRNGYVLNMHQLARFGVPVSALPPDAELRFREVSVWEAYAWQIGAVAAVLLLQAGMITALLLQRRVRRKAEAALDESEHRMAQAAAATGLCMWMHDRISGEFWANPLLRRELGLADGEACSVERFLAGVHADDAPPVRVAIDRAWGDLGRFDVEHRAVVAGGITRWVAMRATVERDAQGRPWRMRGVVMDISARKKAELEAEQHRNELTHLSRVGMLGQLSGSLAHELNQPLTAILSNAQAAQRFLKIEPVDLDEIREILADIVTDDQRAGDVIRRLRALFMRGETQAERIDLHRLVGEVVRLVQGDLASRRVTVLQELQVQPAWVLGDTVQLQQLLMNLVLNACEAMTDLPEPRRLLRIRSERRGDELRLLVIDQGKGIAADQLEQIFQPFVTTKDLGIGLGLAISRSIALAHGGRLWAEKSDSSGATLCLALPAWADVDGRPATVEEPSSA